MSKPKVKICCISSIEEARLAIDAGVDVLGLVSEMPSGPGVITNKEIAEILETIPKGMETFLLTSKQTATEIIHQHQEMPTTGIQIVDYIDPEELRVIKQQIPNIHHFQAPK